MLTIFWWARATMAVMVRGATALCDSTRNTALEMNLEPR